MKYYETKIGKIIEQEFDTRVESAVFIYIMDKGIERIKRITDEDIAGIEGDGLDDEEVENEIQLYAVVNKECLKDGE